MAPKQSKTLTKTLNSKQALAEAASYFKDNDLQLNPPVKRAACSDCMAWVLAAMSHLVYDRFEEKDGKAKELLIAKLNGGGFEQVDGYVDPDTDTQAFMVKTREYAVLAFRGIEITKRQDIKTDIAATRVVIIEGRVHTGFIQAYKSIEKQIEASIEKVKDSSVIYHGPFPGCGTCHDCYPIS